MAKRAKSGTGPETQEQTPVRDTDTIGQQVPGLDIERDFNEYPEHKIKTSDRESGPLHLFPP